MVLIGRQRCICTPILKKKNVFQEQTNKRDSAHRDFVIALLNITISGE